MTGRSPGTETLNLVEAWNGASAVICYILEGKAATVEGKAQGRHRRCRDPPQGHLEAATPGRAKNAVVCCPPGTWWRTTVTIFGG